MFQIRLLLLLLSCLSGLQAVSAASDSQQQIRFATFNIAMGLKTRDDLYQRLQSGDDQVLKKVAAVIQKIRPDVLLLNEFDWSERNSAELFVSNYLEKTQYGNKAIGYAYTLTTEVNTGLDSKLDLNNNGILAEAVDAWGFGQFHGQYAMAVFSRLPLELKRSFQLFKWSDMPDALRVLNADGTDWYPDEVGKKLRLSSKNHLDIAVSIDDQIIHFLASHPTPPVFDGPEDRNGTRNHDEIRFWADYVDPKQADYVYDDTGTRGGLNEDAKFVIAGDLNSDPVDGDSHNNAIGQLLGHPLVNSSCIPASKGGIEASKTQGGKNLEHKGNPAFDTGDFNDQYSGNMRVDYVLPSTTLEVIKCGVYWPATNESGHELINVSDHHLVWLDVRI